MADISFSVQVIPDKSQDFKCNSSASALDVISRVARLMTDQDGKPIDLSEYKVLIAYQLLSPEIGMSRLFHENLQIPASLTTLDDLKVQTGYYVLFVKPATVSTKLELCIGTTLFRLEKTEIVIGRRDDEKGIDPDVDLTPFLAGNELKISRQLLVLNEVNGIWQLKLHPNARTSVFLDSQKLQYNAIHYIQNDSAISIGNSPEQPYLKITTKLVSD